MHAEAPYTPADAPGPHSPLRRAQISVHAAYEEILYSSAGALQNLSRHPGNRDLIYQ